MTETTADATVAFGSLVRHHLLGELVLIYPVAAIMMGEHDVEPFDLSLLFALWSLAVVAAEVPTGVLADRVSRRRLLIVSRLVKGCCFLTWRSRPDTSA